MKTIPSDSAELSQSDPPICVGPPFAFENSSCMPVLPAANSSGNVQPVGFLVAQSAGVSFVAAPRPGHYDPLFDRVSLEWTRQQDPAEPSSFPTLPTEYWYG